MRRNISLSFLMPAYNDEDSIVAAVREAQRVGRETVKRFDILVLNDASPDKTADELEKLKKQVSQLSVATHTRNRGYGATIKDLYWQGTGEWLFSVPGDYQIPARELAKLLPFIHRADMIIGKRVDRADTAARRRQSAVYNFLLKMLFGLTVTDANSVRLMKRSLVHSLKLTSESAFVDAELTIRAQEKGFEIIEVPIGHEARRDNKPGGGGKWHIIVPTIIDMVRFWFVHILS